METLKGFRIVEYEPKLAEPIVLMWMQSKREALGEYNEPHGVDGFMDFLTNKLSKTHTIKVALSQSTGDVVGFVAYKDNDLGQIYLAPAAQGQGLGTALLEMAKEASPNHLLCYTFQKNIPAQKFYEKHGFKAIKYGTENEENLPDILFEWKGA